MSLGRTRLVAAFQAGEDAVLLLQSLGSGALYLDHVDLVNVRSRGDGVEVEVLAEHDDTSALGVVSRGTSERHNVLLWRGVGSRICRNRLGHTPEEVEHVLERSWVILLLPIVSEVVQVRPCNFTYVYLHHIAICEAA